MPAAHAPVGVATTTITVATGHSKAPLTAATARHVLARICQVER